MSKNEQKTQVNIIGAGLAGLSAARTFAQHGICVRMISFQHSERAQSNLAEGGMNAVMNVMGEDDRVDYHFEDTMKGGCFLGDPEMVRGMVETAPEIIRQMWALGVPFHTENGKLIQRNFGGQKHKRTTYAMSSTGKVLVAALTSAVRRYEAEGLVTRLGNHTFEQLLFEDGKLSGVQIYDRFQKKRLALRGPVLMACGGMNGMFEGATTGTTANTGAAAAILFSQGVRFGNLEFLQYHPTTVQITGKRLLISEAARGEGGRLFCIREGKEPDDSPVHTQAIPEEDRCYFMEEKFGERGNLMPRDVISREMSLLGKQPYLDLTILDEKTWKTKLSDLRKEVIHYMGIDPAKVPIPVSPGIHYFMGGILVDKNHRTNIRHLYAAGECACAYHGANRLGGNSLLGAIYGGQKAAQGIMQEVYGVNVGAGSSGTGAGSSETGTGSSGMGTDSSGAAWSSGNAQASGAGDRSSAEADRPYTGGAYSAPDEDDPCMGEKELQTAAFSPITIHEQEIHEKMIRALMKGMAPLRTRERMTEAIEEVASLEGEASSQVMKAELMLADTMIQCALDRTETRGAHTRLDYPDTDPEWRKTTVAGVKDGRIEISYEEITPYPAT